MTTPDSSPAPSADPDFATLYKEREGESVTMTPRMAYWLWSSSVYLSDTWRCARGDPEPLLDDLPPIARPYAKGDWFGRFTDCFEHLATRIAAGDGDQERLATCTGEELALHLVIDIAEAHLADRILGTDIEEAGTLPDHGDDDRDFEAMRDLLFRDHDVLLLFDPSLDGAEDPDGELDRFARFANLHPRDWFLPFADDPAAP